MGGQKRLYQKWLSINEKSKLIHECRLVSNIFASINLAIKSVSDAAFLNNKNNQIMEDAIRLIFDNANFGLANSFRRWREANQSLKYKDRIN